MTIAPDIVSLEDYRRYFDLRVAPDVRAYISGGGGDGLTQRFNREAFDRIRLSGRVLADMSGASTRMTLFGQTFECPIFLAPVALHRLVHKAGEIETATGAAIAGVPMTVSSMASIAIEEIAAAAATPLWFQLYMQYERADTLELVRRAENAGYQALVVTVDAPVNGARNHEQRAGFSLPPGVRAVNLDGFTVPVSSARPGQSPVFLGLLERAAVWRDIEWLRSVTTLPLILKGIMHPGDARMAIERGADAIVVSNHGGRTLDTLPATIEVLPEIVSACERRIPVLMDGGVRRGTDIFKSLALGATAVMIGSPQLHALAVGGAAGVAHMLTILRCELEIAMTLTGCRDIASISQDSLWRDQGFTVA